MADPSTRLSSNAPGPWFVDDGCIDCDICRTVAPDNFARDEGLGLSVVLRQPRDADEVELCREAMEQCPVDAIGEDPTAAQPAGTPPDVPAA